ncbi:MAG: PDZ domain-containing protein [Planctomycetes bacterium]|nr:PDZ domain-containing protein [Planctomycetota bacterium]
MSRTTRPGHRPAFILLAVLLFAFPVKGRADELEDVRKEIAEVEKQILELGKRLEDLKNRANPPGPGTVPTSAVKKMNWRCVGPANMGGRITAIAVVETDPSTYYVATASGGLLKTTNNGTTFTHLFDHEATVSIGDVAVSPSEPNTIWVGTGENNPRNSVSYGDGVYKSTDGGKTWTNMGLKKSFQVGKIVVHPKDANTVYVGALGRLYGPGDERGLFKTEDGGKTWKKILYVDDKTGVIDFRLDPFESNTLLVGMWERKRDGFDGVFGDAKEWPSPDQYGPEITYGAGGGLFRSTDAGKTWKKLTDAKLTNGLPTVKTGRIGLDFSRKTKGLVFAIIDTENIGKGRQPLTVTMGISSDTNKGGGVKIESVTEDGPVGKAGIKDGDIITALDGVKLTDYDALIEFMSKKKPDDVVKFTVKRGDKELDFDVKLVAKATDERPMGPPTLGIQLGNGLLVAGVAPDGPAAKAGVKAGDTITAIGGTKIDDARALTTARAKLKAGDKVKLTVTREGKPMEFELTLGAAPKAVTPPLRPFQLQPVVGGQQANVQKDQGTTGYQTGGVYASKDSGETWHRVNSLNPRPFYFSQVRCDPNDEKVVYVHGDLQLWRSNDGGTKFSSSPIKGVHPDHHAQWIDPKDSRHMLLGGDGGFYTTYDRGETWDHHNSVALGQFYHVSVDNKKPYNIYGGLQDNGCWGGPSQTLRGIGPVNDDWLFLNGGDGFVMRVDSADPNVVYAESQNGGMNWRNLRTGESRGIGRNSVKPGEPLRYNWNSPYILSSHNPNIFYSGSQYVFKSVMRGTDLKAISPDMTSSKKGTLTAIAESPKNADVLWAGTDDGNLWITRDGGTKWENVLDKLKAAGLPGPRWVASIEPGRTVEGRCYVCLDAHRSDDDKPYLFVTEDFGQTWKPLTANLPAFGSTRVLREDITNPSVLYCGTEFGVWVSINRGVAWANLNNNLPTVAIHEIAQPTTAAEIVVGTHGRSIWILDVASIRQMSSRTETVGKDEKTIDPLREAVTLFAPATATRWKMEAGRESPYSRDARKFYGTNPVLGASFDYLLTKSAKAVSLKVTDAVGTMVREFRTAPAEVGFHRLQWNLSGPKGTVPAGGYRVTLTVDGKDYTQLLTVENDLKADPKAIISFVVKRRGFEIEQEEYEKLENAPKVSEPKED